MILATVEAILVPVGAVAVAVGLFSIFLLGLGKSPQTFFELLWRGGFGTAFSWQNTLTRTAPLIFTALAVALPARLGLMIIGGEGALVIGGFAAAVAALPFLGAAPAWVILPIMFVAAAAAGAAWIGFVGALRHARHVNETISSLLMFYIAVAILNFFVEGMLRSPADPNKPSTTPIGSENMIGVIPGLEVHWGLAFGVVLAIAAHVLMTRTTFGFAARVTGGNVRAARAQGLPVGKLMVAACALAGASAGIAGFFEVAAILGKANASLGGSRGLLRVRPPPRQAKPPVGPGLRLPGPPLPFPRPPQSDRHPAGRRPLRRARGGRRPDPAPHGAAGCDGAGAAGADLPHHPPLRDGLWPDPVPQAGGPSMSDALTTVAVAMFAGAVRVSTPFLFVSLGETLTEKSGRINLGLEGTLVFGAMSAYAVSYLSGNPWVGVLAAGLAGSVFGMAHGFFCRLPKVSDIAIGIALMLFGTGLAFFFGKGFIQPTAPRLQAIDFGFLVSDPQLKVALQINPLFFIGLALAVVMWWALANTRFGLIVRMTGDSAAPAKAMGVSVDLVRFVATTIGGFLAGVGGAFLSLYYPGSWNEGLSSGQGLMAVALVIFARWNPLMCVAAALLFGAAGALGPALQSVGISQGYPFFNAAPHILTLAILIASSSSKRSLKGAPGELSITK